MLLGASAILLGILVLGVRELAAGGRARAALATRSALDEVDAEARRLRSRLDRALRRTPVGAWLRRHVDRAGLEISALDLGLVLLLASVVAFVVVDAVFPLVIAVAVAAVAVRGVFVWLERRRAQRQEEFVAQLPELARIISNAASAGRSIPSAISLATTELTEPASIELGRVSEELRLGRSLTAALDSLRERMPSRETAVLVTTLLIQQRSGGDMVTALREMAETLDDRKELRREVTVIMSGAVFTGYVTAGLGLGTLFLLNLMDPGLLDDMAASWPGRVAFVLAGVLYAAAFVMIRRATQIEV